MKASVFIKCGPDDTTYYLQALIESKLFDVMDVYRDNPTKELPTVNYRLNRYFKTGFMRFVERFMLACLEVAKPDYYIGVYEIPHGLMAFVIAKLFKKKVIISVIGNPANSRVRKGLRLRITKFVLRYSDAVTVTGQRSKEILHNWGISDESVHVLPNSIPVELFRDKHIVDKQYDVISLGRISTEKHIELIVEIVKSLSITLHIKAAIGGMGPELGRIIQIVKDYGLEEAIDVQGFIPDNELESFFNSGKIFVVCSETEGFPRTILQAASCGSLIVSSSVGDIPEIIRNGENGFLVAPYDNIDEYCSFITQALRDSDASLNMSQRLQKEVHNLFSTESAAKVWVSIFKSV